MALDASKIMAGFGTASGAGEFKLGDYVTAGGAGTLVDLGHVKNPYELAGAMENFDETTERATGIVLTEPISDSHEVKVAFHQSEIEILRIAYGQPSANKSGSGNNLTLLIGDRVSQYHQATLQVKGPGTTAKRLMTFWKLQVIAREAISFGKSTAQLVITTFRILRDDSVVTADKYFKFVDS